MKIVVYSMAHRGDVFPFLPIASEMPGPWRAAARDENLAPGLAVLGSAWCCRARLRD